MRVLKWGKTPGIIPKRYFGVCNICKTSFYADKGDVHAVDFGLTSGDLSYYAYCPYCWGIVNLKEVDMNAPNLSKEGIQAIPTLQKFDIDWLLKAVSENDFKTAEELIAYAGEQEI